MPDSGPVSLVRAIGRWSMAALVINSIIGSGIFGLPSDLAKLLGNASPYAVLIAGGAMGVIMACFAEVASRFTQAGGPYLYSRVAFGRLVGIEMGWMLWLVRLTAPAANASLFVIYLREFWPRAMDPFPRLCVLTLLIGILAVTNLRGVRAGAEMSNIFTVAKLVPLFLVAIAGAVYVSNHQQTSNATANMLAVPRLTFALAEQQDFPAIFAAVHPRFRTPYFSILVFATLVWLFALLGNFTWNVTLSAAARLFCYGAGCAALPVLRRKQPGGARFHLPAGSLLALIGVAVCVVLITQIDLRKSLILVAVIITAFLNWMAVRNRESQQTTTQISLE